MNILLQWNIFGKGNYLVLKDNKETDKKLAFSTEIELNIWSLNLVYLIQRTRNVYHHKTKQWTIVFVSPSWILIDFSFQDAVKFCDAKSCWNANMSAHTAGECELLVCTTDLVRILVKQGPHLFRFLTNLFCCNLSLFISLEGKFPAWQYKLIVLQ